MKLLNFVKAGALVLIFSGYAGNASARYMQADPTGLDGGINNYAYAEGNPVMNIDPNGLETCVVVTTTSIGFRDHAALYISGNSNAKPFLYDPSGSYALSHGGGTGDFVEGSAADLKKFAKYHKKSKVETTCKATDVAEEKRLMEKIVEMESAGIAQCSVSVSNVLSGSKYFPKVTGGTVFPGNLYRDAAKTK